MLLTRCDQVERAERGRLRATIARLAPGVPSAETTHRPVGLGNGDAAAAALDRLRGRPVAAFCGIGNPEAFRRTLRDLGADVVAFRTFPDHHAYARADVEELRAWARAAGNGLRCGHDPKGSGQAAPDRPRRPGAVGSAHRSCTSRPDRTSSTASWRRWRVAVAGGGRRVKTAILHPPPATRHPPPAFTDETLRPARPEDLRARLAALQGLRRGPRPAGRRRRERRRLARQPAAATGRQRPAPGARPPLPGLPRRPHRRRRPGRPRHQDRLRPVPDRLDAARRRQGAWP